MRKTCEICEKPSGMYPLCPACFKLRDEGKIIKCDKCGKWHRITGPCNCKDKLPQQKEPNNTHDEEKPQEKETQKIELTCIVCGQPSNGMHFCRKCYAKYKDRSIDIRITHCSQTEVLDEYGNLTIKCDDGRKVRSRAEALIYNWLFKEKIRAIYEETIFYKDSDTGETKTLHPDFFLPDYGIYIEYNELTNKPYLSKKEYAKKIYESLNKKVIIMTDKDINDISACLKPILDLN